MSKKIFKSDELIDYITLEDGRKLYLTKHSQYRLKTRKISDIYIKETFTNPDIIIPNKDFDNAKNYIKTIEGKRIKIGIKDDIEPFVLITAFIQQTN